MGVDHWVDKTRGTCPPLLEVEVMFQSVSAVKVLYVFKYWLTTVFAWWRFLLLTLRIPQIGILFIFCPSPTFCVGQRPCRHPLNAEIENLVVPLSPPDDHLDLGDT